MIRRLVEYLRLRGIELTAADIRGLLSELYDPSAAMEVAGDEQLALPGRPVAQVIWRVMISAALEEWSPSGIEEVENH